MQTGASAGSVTEQRHNLGRRSRIAQAQRVAVRLVLWAAATLVLLEFTLRVGAYVISQRTEGSVGKGQHRILCVGDSFTFGVGVKDEDKYPAVLERLINEHFSTQKYRVVNLGRPASSSGYVLHSLDRWLRVYRPEAVLLMTGWNCNDQDIAAYHARTGGEGGLTRIKLGLTLNRLRTYRLARYALARLQSAPPESAYRLVISMDLYDFRDYQAVALTNLVRICDKLKQRRIPTVLLTYPQAPPLANPYTDTEPYHAIHGTRPIAAADYLFGEPSTKIAVNRVIVHVAESYSIPVADIAQAFSGHKHAEVFIPEDHHPNAAGNRIIAETVLDTLVRSGIVAISD